MGGTHASKTRPRKLLASLGLSTDDFRAHVVRHAASVAPTDVRDLVAGGETIRRKLLTEDGDHPVFHAQVTLALDLLTAHDAGHIPHVPYSAVSMLAAALLYYLDPFDVIPDCVEGVGTVDDRLVMAVAHAEAADGIARYRAWREETNAPDA